MAYRPFEHVEQAPIDPILGITEAYRNDPNPKKVNLSVGVYLDETGVNPVLSSVKQAERYVLENETTKDYLPIAGEAGYGTCVQQLAFGAEHPVVREGRAATLHTPGGTGALRVAGDFLHAQYGQPTVWMSEPTWPNHPGVFRAAGLPVKTYPYYEPATHGLKFDELLQALEQVPEGDVVLLHACCHNPTGVDPTPEQWDRIVEVFQRRPILALLDFAYQGFGSGLDEDAYAVRAFASAGVQFLMASSFSKNFGLYRERAGALTVVADEAPTAKRVFERIRLSVRANYSNPPSHGGQIVQAVLGSPELKALWLEEVAGMRGRIQAMRKLFVDTLRAKGVERDFGFLLEQQGMFSYSGIGKEEVRALREQYGIYLVESGRINVAAMTAERMDYLCDSVARVLAG